MDKTSGEIQFTEETEISWRNSLRTFKELVWPVMQEEGLSSFDTAYMAWHIAMLDNSITELQKTIEELDGF
jgi:hypothetical protein